MANSDRIADALERLVEIFDYQEKTNVRASSDMALHMIADALKRQADADPLTVMSQMLGDDSAEMPPTSEPQAPYASNGQTYMYQHPAGPDSGYDIVARRDEAADGGYVVTVERS